MGSDVGQIFQTASLHRDLLILYALVCEKEFSHMGKNSGHTALVCKKFEISYRLITYMEHFRRGETN